MNRHRPLKTRLVSLIVPIIFYIRLRFLLITLIFYYRLHYKLYLKREKEQVKIFFVYIIRTQLSFYEVFHYQFN